jgi:CYTH domain-containing protein
LSRYEVEKEIDPDEAQELMKLCEKSEETGKPLMIDKTRYLVKSGRHTFEVDEFHGENEGLVVAEVELHSEDEDYLLPDFINKEDEVTGDRKYYNSQLLKHPFSTWPKDGESAVR